MADSAATIMTRNVISVGPDAPVVAVAALLVKHGISAVPVVDKSGKLCGMISEGDLMKPFGVKVQARREWWLEMLAEGERLAPEFLAYISEDHHTAGNLMTRDLVTVTESATVPEVADLLIKNRIKRVPVVRDGAVVGIVSRADIVRTLARSAPT
ncbi:MAG TPA: CBS domain-containing protein [Acidocella sp.]|nr:CBS domain-containing protein [Acidocella sp.]